MNLHEVLHLQLRLEGKQIVHGDQLRQVEIVPDEDMPLLIIVKFADEKILSCYDETLRPDLSEQLRNRIHNIIFPGIDLVVEFLRTQNISFDIGHYKTYSFPKAIVDSVIADVRCLSKQDSLIQAFGFGDFTEQVYAVERDGRIASACVSVRENARCGEAWVYTDENYRRQGFAQQVVSAWAKDMLNAGKVPFYSHKIENTASANLAKRLELQSIFEQIVISYVRVLLL